VLVKKFRGLEADLLAKTEATGFNDSGVCYRSATVWCRMSSTIVELNYFRKLEGAIRERVRLAFPADN
jgi:hypothetical protein